MVVTIAQEVMDSIPSLEFEPSRTVFEVLMIVDPTMSNNTTAAFVCIFIYLNFMHM